MHEQDEVTVRQVPATRYVAIGWLALALVVTATAAWEWRMRLLGLRAGDLDDGKSHWSVERRKLAAGDHDGVVILGGSRILFDTDLDVWEEMTGRRPIQLAMGGMSGQRFLADVADNSDFAGLVVIDVTPEQFFREGPGIPEFEGVLDYWKDEGPSKRSGHQIGQFLSRYLAFLDDHYTLVEAHRAARHSESRQDQRSVSRCLEVGGKLRRPADRPVAGNRNERAPADHAMRVWLARDRPPPERRPDRPHLRRRAQVGREDPRARRRRGVHPSALNRAYYEREQSQSSARQDLGSSPAARSGAFGIHFEDYPEMQGLELPERSHLTRESATRFTRAYVGVLRERYVGLRSGPVAHPVP